MQTTSIHGATRKDPWLGYFTLDNMLAAFLQSASSDGRTNAAVVESVVGASRSKSAIDVVDPATYDGASGRHGKRCRTFREAFAACAEPWDRYGHRHWRTFDLETLQGCHEGFRALRLPEWVEARHVEEQLAEHYASGSYGDDISEATIPF